MYIANPKAITKSTVNKSIMEIKHSPKNTQLIQKKSGKEEKQFKE